MNGSTHLKTHSTSEKATRPPFVHSPCGAPSTGGCAAVLRSLACFNFVQEIV